MGSQQLLWQYVFKDEQLIIRLIKDHAAACSNNSVDLLQESEDEVTIESSKWGPIKLKFWAATALGDNFLSDAYIASAKLDNGKVEYRSFIKVSHLSLMYFTTKILLCIFTHSSPFLICSQGFASQQLDVLKGTINEGLQS